MTDSNERPSNHLSGQTSPYLLQHVHNPVDWYPWGEEAFERSRAENKPIFLSIGYSACHWCHVMERECFENEAIARVLNAGFISVKVDREEFPAVDDVYMTAVQLMTGSGGWPLSVFLTPDLRPFFGGTYFPPDDAPGRAGFKTILERISSAWVSHAHQLGAGADEVVAAVRNSLGSSSGGTPGPLSTSIAANAVRSLERHFDKRWGGFGGAPKFPPSATLGFLLKYHRRAHNASARDMVMLTLERMAAGGLYDQLGGGFHRYTVDERWLVPHFEKMLYDNALLAMVYLEAGRSGEGDGLLRVARETLDYVLRDMTAPSGAFYAAEDADSEGREGAFYVWTRAEIMTWLGAKEGGLFCDWFGVTDEGNFEGSNILTRGWQPQKGPDDWAERDRLRERLLERRNRRVRPGRDEKIIVGWNSLMISALCRGYQVLGPSRYLDAAVLGAGDLLSRSDGGTSLRHSYRNGPGPDAAHLDDHALLILALLDVYESTLDRQWLESASRIRDRMMGQFKDPSGVGFYSVGAGHANLIARPKPFMDGATPPGNASAAEALLRLGRLTGRSADELEAERLLASVSEGMTQHPSAYMSFLNVLELSLADPVDIVILGDPADPQTKSLLHAACRAAPQQRVIAGGGREPGYGGLVAPWVDGKAMQDGKPTAYVCCGNACRPPVTSASDLETLLR